MEYAAVQQFGSFSKGSSPWGKIPARPFLGISHGDRANIVDIAFQYAPDQLIGRYDHCCAGASAWKMFQSAPDQLIGRYMPRAAQSVPTFDRFNPRPTN